MLGRITEEAKEWGKVEQTPRFEGRNFTMVLTPLQSQKQLHMNLEYRFWVRVMKPVCLPALSADRQAQAGMT